MKILIKKAKESGPFYIRIQLLIINVYPSFRLDSCENKLILIVLNYSDVNLFRKDLNEAYPFII